VPSEVSTNAKLPFLMPFGKKASVDLGPISRCSRRPQAWKILLGLGPPDFWRLLISSNLLLVDVYAVPQPRPYAIIGQGAPQRGRWPWP
jgi:hypothetical protein